MRIALVEDDPILLESLSILLSGEPDIAVSGTFLTAEEALKGLQKASPDILIADLGLPGMPGVDLIGKAKNLLPDVEVMAYTIYEDRDNVFAAIKAGASGYVLKGCTPKEFIEAIHSLHSGGAPMSPKIARRLIREFQDEVIKEEYLLTHREKEVVEWIEKGFLYKEIAGKLNISPHTVHTHIKNIYEKLQAKSRQEALLKARKKGII